MLTNNFLKLKGDGGSGLILTNKLVGVVSVFFSNDKKSFVFTNVRLYNYWINEIIRKEL